MHDFIIVDRNEKPSKSKNLFSSINTKIIFPAVRNQCDQCEQLCFPNAINQTEIVCGCTQYYTLDDNGRSCSPKCTE